MTHYVQITQRVEDFHIDHWHPWLNCKDREETAKLAANNFFRERGGFDTDRDTLGIQVWLYTSDCPKHENGNPMACYRTDFLFTRDK